MHHSSFQDCLLHTICLDLTQPPKANERTVAFKARNAGILFLSELQNALRGRKSSVPHPLVQEVHAHPCSGDGVDNSDGYDSTKD